ncbi:MAG: hypothetical protein ACJ8DI_22180 [Ktedonobacteraceae bacterium]
MSYQPKDQDTIFVRMGPNSFHLHKYDSRQGKFVDRYHGDLEGVTNIMESFAEPGSDFHPVPIAHDQNGNPIYRLKKYMK